MTLLKALKGWAKLAETPKAKTPRRGTSFAGPKAATRKGSLAYLHHASKK